MYSAKQLKSLKIDQCYIAAVLDGHGMLGEEASRQAGRVILSTLRHSPLLQKRALASLSDVELEILMDEAFQAGHKAALAVAIHAPSVYTYPLGARGAHSYVLKSLGNGDKAYIDSGLNVRMLEFGTTATVALVQGRAVAVANVGDSLAVLGSERDDAYHVDLLSRRHWGGDAGERKRIEEEVGDSAKLEDDDGYLTVTQGRLTGYQLAMTRALGHRLLSSYGVIQTPSIKRHTLSADDLCLVVASDGLWESLSPSETVSSLCDLLSQGRSVPEAALELVRSAVEFSMGNNPGVGADNTTAAVFVFDDILDDEEETHNEAGCATKSTVPAKSTSPTTSSSSRA